MNKTFIKQTIADTEVLVLTVPEGKNYRIDALVVSGQNTGGSINICIATNKDNEPPLELEFTISPKNTVMFDDHITIPAGGTITINSPYDGIVVTVSVLTTPVEG